MTQDLRLTSRAIRIFGGLAILGGSLAVLADVYSAYSTDHKMDSAFAVGLASVVDILQNQPPDDLLIGSLLGQYFIPFHIFGLILMYFALAPASAFFARIALVLGVYATIIGTSLHASLIYVGAVARDNTPETIARVSVFFDITAYSMVFAILFLVLVIAVFILSGKSFYPRWTILLCPPGYMVITTIILSTAPVLDGPVKAFVTASGFNLPLTIFHATTMMVLLGKFRDNNVYEGSSPR